MSTRIGGHCAARLRPSAARRAVLPCALALCLLGTSHAAQPPALCESYDGLPKSGSTAVPAGMVLLPGGTFRMGSDRFYPEEAPVRPVTVGPFAIARHEVTNAQFQRFVRATGYRTVAERPLDAKDHPQLTPEQRRPGSLVFRQPRAVKDLVDLNQWWV
jgi:formylglycine-generating enzyme required for sulfatase activity